MLQIAMYTNGSEFGAMRHSFILRQHSRSEPVSWLCHFCWAQATGGWHLKRGAAGRCSKDVDRRHWRRRGKQGKEDPLDLSSCTYNKNRLQDVVMAQS